MPLGEQRFVEIARLLLLDEPGQGHAPLVIRENFRAITQPKKLGGGHSAR
jgi:ABC-type branched-subunit amino acid transport system ATPase component